MENKNNKRPGGKRFEHRGERKDFKKGDRKEFKKDGHFSRGERKEFKKDDRFPREERKEFKREDRPFKRRDDHFKPRHDFKRPYVRSEELEIKRLGINGEGIGYINKKITFVNGALPGEVVEVEVTKDEPKFKEARILKVKQHSEHRVATCCDIQNHCLNCPLMIMDDESIMYFKKDIIRDSLRKYAELDFNMLEMHNPILADEKVDYVNTVHLPIVLFNDKPRVGIYQRGSKFLTVMDECKLYHPIIRSVIKGIEEILENDQVPVYNDETHYGIRFVTIRVIEEKALVVIVCGRNGLDPKTYEKISQIEYVSSIYYTVNTSKGQNFAAGRYMKVFGTTNQEATVNGIKYVLTPKTDFPENVNSEVKVIKAVESLLDPEKKEIFDVNCGAGYLSNSLVNYHIKAIDYSRYNIQDAAYAAKSNRLEHVDYEYGDVPALMEKISKNREFDTFIVHEAKLGMNTATRENVIKSKVNELIYISHSASSFAKDVGSLAGHYALRTIIPIDFHSYNEEIVIVAKFVRNDKKGS